MQLFRAFQAGERTHTDRIWDADAGTAAHLITDHADGRFLATSFRTLDEAKTHCESLVETDKTLVLYIVDRNEEIVYVVEDREKYIQAERKREEEDRRFAAKCWIAYFVLSGALLYGLAFFGPIAWPWFAGVHLGLSVLYLALLAYFGAGQSIEMGVAVVVLLLLFSFLLPLVFG